MEPSDHGLIYWSLLIEVFASFYVEMNELMDGLMD